MQIIGAGRVSRVSAPPSTEVKLMGGRLLRGSPVDRFERDGNSPGDAGPPGDPGGVAPSTPRGTIGPGM